MIRWMDDDNDIDDDDDDPWRTRQRYSLLHTVTEWYFMYLLRTYGSCSRPRVLQVPRRQANAKLKSRHPGTGGQHRQGTDTRARS